MRIPVITDWLEKRKATLKEPDDWMAEAFGTTKSYTGKNVKEETAMKSSAVFACVRIISESVAMLPLIVYQREERGKSRAMNHLLYDVLKNRPNPEMSAYNYKEAMLMHLLLWGNHYAEIEYRGDGKPRALWPLLPSQTTVYYVGNGRERVYVTYLPNGEERRLTGKYVLHIPGMAFDGLQGLSPIGYARESIGLDLATEEFGSRFFGQGTNMGAVAKHPGKLSDEAYHRLKKDMERKHEGLGNAHRLMLLEEGMDIEKIGIPPDNAQFLETRQFQKRDIARIFRVPLYLLADVEKGSSYASIEQQSLDFLKYSIQPWLARIEQAVNNQLFTPESRKQYFAEFLIDSLLRADIQTRYQAYSTGINYGFLTINEVRAMENMNPSDAPEADQHFIQQNMMPIDQANQQEDNGLLRSQIIRSAQGRAPEKRGGRSRLEKSKQRENEVRQRAARIVAKEKKDVLEKASEHLERSQQGFQVWLEGYYEELGEDIKTEMRPVFKRLAQDMRDDVAEDIDIDKTLSEDDEEFLEEYLETYSKRYTNSSKGQLAALLRNVGEADEEEYALIEERLKEWEEKRPDKEARNETRQLGNAITRAIMAGAGVKYLVWRNAGNDTCDYCKELNGKVVGIDQPFLGGNEKLEAEGEEFDMKVKRPSFHPPIHFACECQIEPEG